MLYGIEKLDADLPNFDYIITGEAVHGNEWNPYASDIFDWLNDIGGVSETSAIK